MKENNLLEKYYEYFKNEDWLNAQKILEVLISSSKEESFWLYTSLSSVFYELKNYDEALKYSKLAYSLNPESPLVLWDYAGVLYMLNKEQEAIDLWQIIIKTNEDVLAFELTTAGLRWARTLKNDALYRIAQAYYYLENDKLALEYAMNHLNNRKKGQKSLYKKSEILSLIEKMKGDTKSAGTHC